MIPSIRDRIQSEAIKAIKKAKYTGIIDVSPRVGKSKLIIDCLNLLKKKPKIIITAPYNTILDSWREEFDKWSYKHKETTSLINQRSLSKVDLDNFDLIIIDECHSLSDFQIGILRASKTRKLGMSGSISDSTKQRLRDTLNLKIIYKYTVDEAVDDDIVSDYEINIITLPLDQNKKYIEAGSKKKRLKLLNFKTINT
jgi:superfamily II DNA or RNA helicase